jgi:hypothetical protein
VTIYSGLRSYSNLRQRNPDFFVFYEHGNAGIAHAQMEHSFFSAPEIEKARHGRKYPSVGVTIHVPIDVDVLEREFSVFAPRRNLYTVFSESVGAEASREANEYLEVHVEYRLDGRPVDVDTEVQIAGLGEGLLLERTVVHTHLPARRTNR